MKERFKWEEWLNTSQHLHVSPGERSCLQLPSSVMWTRVSVWTSDVLEVKQQPHQKEKGSSAILFVSLRMLKHTFKFYVLFHFVSWRDTDLLFVPAVEQQWNAFGLLMQKNDACCL